MTINIGDRISINHRGQSINGRIVGLEASAHRRGYPTRGLVAVVQPDVGEASETYIAPDASSGLPCGVETT